VGKGDPRSPRSRTILCGSACNTYIMLGAEEANDAVGADGEAEASVDLGYRKTQEKNICTCHSSVCVTAWASIEYSDVRSNHDKAKPVISAERHISGTTCPIQSARTL